MTIQRPAPPRQEIDELQESHDIEDSQEPQKLRSRKKQKNRSHGIQETESTEETQASASIALVETLSAAVEISLKAKVNKNTLFLFSQAIKAFEIHSDNRLAEQELIDAFNFWWATANRLNKLPASAVYQLYMAKFKCVFRRTKKPLRVPPLDDAMAYADSHAPDLELGVEIGRLLLVCERLQQITAPGPFFLSFREAAKILVTKDTYEAMGAMEHLADLGHIKCVEVGKGTKASRYRFGKPL